MNRRKFFTALAAVFAAPKLLKAGARWIVPPHKVHPAWLTLSHELRYGLVNRHGQKYIIPIIYKRPVSPGLRIDAEDAFKL